MKIIRFQCVCPFQQIASEAFDIGILRGLLEQRADAIQLIPIGRVIRHSNQLIAITADQRVQAALVGQVGCFELFACHVLRVKTRAGWFRAHVWHKGLVAIEAIPRPIVDCCKTPRRIVTDARQKLLAISVRLQPEQIVHDVRGCNQQRQHLFLPGRQCAEIRGQLHGRINIQPFGCPGFARCGFRPRYRR